MDIENIDFDTFIDSLMQVGKYIRMDRSSVTSSLMYYSHDIAAFRFGTVLLSGMHLKEFRQVKPEHLEDVFDDGETINRVDIYPSSNGTIDAISIEINNRKDVRELLTYLGNNGQNNFNIWMDTLVDKTFILHKEAWTIDNNKMLTINLYIVRTEAKVGSENFVSLIKEYYNP